MATLFGISGVMLWPVFFAGFHKFYPGVMHSRMMIEGFLGGFVLGFLGTALPRLLGVGSLTRVELGWLLGVWVTALGLHIGEQPRLGDLVFIGLLLLFLGQMAGRLRARSDSPPPGFVLVGFGLLSGVAGAALGLLGSVGWVSGAAAQCGSLLLNQAFVLFLLLGIGPFLFPRFLELQNRGESVDGETAGRGWRLRALIAALTGGIVLWSYWLEGSSPADSLAGWVRVSGVLGYFVAMIPFHRQVRPIRASAILLQLGLAALITGLVFSVCWPMQRVAGMHIVFLGGYSLITFTVATRVVFGHSGNGALLDKRLPGLEIPGLMLLAGAVLRAVGDFSPLRPHWLNAAAYLWMVAAGIWGFSVLPKVRVEDPS